ncbi:dephospho-CoA kinase [bacterium]|nr:dephospho-CoA kinase [bacterium]MBU1984336.1 dephospho-CoA kinase [bacterium]
MMQPFLIGLTGEIGVGKSTVARALAELGAEIVVGDELGRSALEESLAILTRIRERFGGEVFATDGSLNRRALGKRVFSAAEDARWLTELTFPGIHALWREQVSRSRTDVLVLDAALIFEWGIEREFDLIVLVSADSESVLHRIERSGRLSRQEIQSRVAAQLSADVKRQKADIVLTNNGTFAELQHSVRELWQARIEPEIQRRRKQRDDTLR